MAKDYVGELRHKRYRLLMQILAAFFGAMMLGAAFYSAPTDWQAMGISQDKFAVIRLAIIVIGAVGGLLSVMLLNGLLSRLEVQMGFKEEAAEPEQVTLTKRGLTIAVLAISFFGLGYSLPVLSYAPIGIDVRTFQGLFFAAYVVLFYVFSIWRRPIMERLLFRRK